jgi:hypothetical protein
LPAELLAPNDYLDDYLDYLESQKKNKKKRQKKEKKKGAEAPQSSAICHHLGDFIVGRLR